MISIFQRNLCRILAILCTITLISCMTAPPGEIAMPAPPGELLAAPAPLTALDAAKPMPQQDYLGQTAVDAKQYLDVANRLSKLQGFVIQHCNCFSATPTAQRATKPPIPLLSATELPERDSGVIEIPGLLPPEINAAS